MTSRIFSRMQSSKTKKIFLAQHFWRCTIAKTRQKDVQTQFNIYACNIAFLHRKINYDEMCFKAAELYNLRLCMENSKGTREM